LVALLALSALLLGAVFGTVVFASTVAYLLVPLYRRVERYGLSPWWASAGTALLASVAALVPLAIGVYFATDRVRVLLDALQELPETVPLSVGEYTYVVDVGVVVDASASYLSDLAVEAAVALPVLAVKFTLFGVLVFGLLMAHEDAEQAVLATLPATYHDVANALGKRVSETLYAIYVLQAVTGLATALVAVPVFLALGVPFPFTLAIAAGVLQFVPIVGPSLVVLGIAGYRASVGDVSGALTVLVVAGLLVAWLPDLLVRPRLSRSHANLPASLYFIGFTGGLLTVGPVGIIAGPLVVALAAESAKLLAEERQKSQSSA
jgi:predicted PurR-regulated permease PerM